MTDKILKRLVDIAKHRRDVEIDTMQQVSIYTGNTEEYYSCLLYTSDATDEL